MTNALRTKLERSKRRDLRLSLKRREELLKELWIAHEIKHEPEKHLDDAITHTISFEEYKKLHNIPQLPHGSYSLEHDSLKLLDELATVLESPTKRPKLIQTQGATMHAGSRMGSSSPMTPTPTSLFAGTKTKMSRSLMEKSAQAFSNAMNAQTASRRPSEKSRTIPLKRKSSVMPGPVEATETDIKGYQLAAWQMKVMSQPINVLLQPARKVVRTKDWLLSREEMRFLKLYNRIENLKAQNLWSFRQIQAQVEPPRKKAHHDYFIEEMKWLSEDFRQERKWKIAMAYTMAKWVIKWHQTSDKSLICTKASLQENKCIRSPMSSLTELNGTDSADGSNDSDKNDVEMACIMEQVVEPQSELVTDSIPPVEMASEYKSLDVKYVLDVNSHVFFIEDVVAAGSAIVPNETPVYGPPQLDDQVDYRGLFTPQDRVVPLSKLIVDRTFANLSSRWDHNGVLRQTPSWTGKDSAGSSSSDAKIEMSVSLFSNSSTPRKSKDDMKKPPGTDLNAGKEAAPWGAEEDETLQSLAKSYQYNWSLVVDALRSHRFSRYVKRTDWDCYNRLMSLKESSKAPVAAVPEGSAGDENTALMPPPKALGKKEVAKQKTAFVKADRSKRFQKLLGSFEMITKCAKKRDSAKPATVIKKINLSAHETHVTSQTNAGIIIGTPPLSALDVSLLKERRDRELRELRLAQEQRLFSGPRPGMPIPGLGVPLPFNQFRPPIRPPGTPGMIPGLPMPGMSNLPGNPALRPGNQLAAAAANMMRMAPGLNAEQMKAAIMARNQMLARGVPFAGMPLPQQFLGDPNANFQHNLAAQQRFQQQVAAAGQPQQQLLRQQLQSDVQSAAAFAALQNASTAVKTQQNQQQRQNSTTQNKS